MCEYLEKRLISVVIGVYWLSGKKIKRLNKNYICFTAVTLFKIEFVDVNPWRILRHVNILCSFVFNLYYSRSLFNQNKNG